MSLEASSEIPVASELCLKSSKPLILMFCSLLMAWWFNSRCWWCGKRSGLSIDILKWVGYHTWRCYVGATINTLCPWFWAIFLKTFFIIKKRWVSIKVLTVVFLWSDKFSEIFVEGAFSLNDLLNFLTANLPPRSWSLEDICSNCDPML